MANEIALNLSNNALVQQMNQQAAETQNDLPYLQSVRFFGKSNDELKISSGTYTIVRGAGDFDVIGDSIDIIPFVQRPMGLDTSDLSNVVEVFSMDHPEMKRIVDTVDAKVPDSGCSYGPVFLVWVRERSMFAKFFFGNASAKRAARSITPALPSEGKSPQAITLRSKLVKNAKNPQWGSWKAPTVEACQTAFKVMPTQEQYDRAVELFLGMKDPAPPAEDAPQRSAKR